MSVPAALSPAAYAVGSCDGVVMVQTPSVSTMITFGADGRLPGPASIALAAWSPVSVNVLPDVYVIVSMMFCNTGVLDCSPAETFLAVC